MRVRQLSRNFTFDQHRLLYKCQVPASACYNASGSSVKNSSGPVDLGHRVKDTVNLLRVPNNTFQM